MSTDNDSKPTLNIAASTGGNKLELPKKLGLPGLRPASGMQARKTVTVEVKRRRIGGLSGGPEGLKAKMTPAEVPAKRPIETPVTDDWQNLNAQEKAARLKAIQATPARDTNSADEELRVLRKTERVQPDVPAVEVPSPEVQTPEAVAQTPAAPVAPPAPLTISRRPATSDEPLKRLVRRFEEPIVRKVVDIPAPAAERERKTFTSPSAADDDKKNKLKKADPRKVEAPANKRTEPRRLRKLTLTGALDDTSDARQRSLASVKRQREKDRLKALGQEDGQKISREVILPEAITVQELANRMAERVADVVKELMKIGVMATATQTIDPDTAELVATELGHTVKRVAESDVETGIKGEADADIDLLPRAPVVTIMGHVDHGKTTLLDALRATDVAGREAGGITQHIGAYKVRMNDGRFVTFLDTPGHEAFTEMRARGAHVTDIVVLVVAADDSIMPQTVEAINHAKAAGVPIIVAINKIDKPAADAAKVKTALLTHELVVEDMGGDVLCVEVSAKQKLNLDKLVESILLQAEILNLRANPNRTAEGAVVEAQLDVGRGSVATVLVQRGTLKIGDVFVCGAEWGRVRAMIDDHGQKIDLATPGTPVEVLGLNGTPVAGDDFIVVENENKARQITDYRTRILRDKNKPGASAGGTMEQMFAKIAEGVKKEQAVVIKTDVHGSLEAIAHSLAKMENDEVAVRVLHKGVGSITESDIALARASNALVIGFNVRANPQARDMAKRDKIDIRYYSIIYNVIDDVKAMLSGLLSPERRETFLGYAQIRQIFDITKVGKVAGCFVTEGVIKRGCGVRLLRDNVVIHEGKLKTLKRLKDEVKEVANNLECGMAFENYHDMREGDVIECFEVQEVARTL